MTKQTINVGTSPNDNRGDSLRASFQKINANFTELYTALGLDTAPLNIGAFEFTGSVLSTTDSTAITIDQATTITSNLTVGGDVLPSVANGGDLGSSARPWRSLYVSNNTIYIGGTAVGLDANGNLTTGGTVVGSSPAWANITGKPTFATVATTGAYADLTGKPTIPTSFDRLVNGAHQFVLNVNGAGPWLSFPESGGQQIQIQGTDIVGIGSFSPNLMSPENGILISANSSAQNGPRRDWQFGTDGSLTLPQDGGIKSDTNIDITVDTPDSSTFNWRFGADGALTFPDGTSQSTAGIEITNAGGANPFVTFPAITGGDQLQIQGAEVSTIAGNLALTSVTDINIISNGSGAAPGGSKNWTFGADGSVTIPGDIRSEGNINIDINLSDSTLRRWRFGEDGELTLPGGGVIADAASYLQLTPAGGANDSQSLLIYPTAGDGNHIHLAANGGTTELYLGNDNHYVKLVNGGNVEVRANNGVNNAAWVFGTTGRTIFPNGTVPEHSYGAAGDLEGMVVFTDPYIYYCKQDYVNNSTDIWVRVAWTGTNW